MDNQNVSRIVASDDTVSNKIRRLAVGGVPRAEIAKLLGKRYQHVRNVLEGDKLGTAPVGVSAGVAEGEATPFRQDMTAYEPHVRGEGISRLVVAEGGWLKLPADLIAAWDLKTGSVLMGHLEGEAFELITGQTSMRRILEFAHSRVPPGGPSWADELSENRRQEFEREIADD